MIDIPSGPMAPRLIALTDILGIEFCLNTAQIVSCYQTTDAEERDVVAIFLTNGEECMLHTTLDEFIDKAYHGG